jgi:alpha-beta hydrolase superfamily lysophospholipase
MEKFQVTLPNGKSLFGAAYKTAGTKRNLVIITGMDEHATRYENFASFLNQQGFDVYVLDTFGQGLNVSKPEEQEIIKEGFFADTVDALHQEVEDLKKSGKPTSLMGHSMGSFMVQSFVERYPNSAKSIIICGSNGPCKGKMHGAYVLSKVIVHKSNWDKPSKLLQKAGLGSNAKAIKNRKTDFDWLSYNEENVKNYMADPYCGHVNTNGFWREFLKGMDTLYQKKNLKQISSEENIFIISGAEDPVGGCGKGPTALKEMYKKYGVKRVSLKLYEKMRHEIHNEIGHEKVYSDIAEFLLAD